jgi:hypothetical protein
MELPIMYYIEKLKELGESTDGISIPPEVNNKYMANYKQGSHIIINGKEGIVFSKAFIENENAAVFIKFGTKSELVLCSEITRDIRD